MDQARAHGDARQAAAPVAADPAALEAAMQAAAAAYFADRRARVPDFVRRHFGLGGSLALHRAALGGDVLRAPVNLALAPVLVLSRIGAWGLRRARLTRAADWLGSKPILLETEVARRVESLILTDLLELPQGTRTRDALTEAMLAQPALRAVVAARAGPEALAGLQAQVSRTLGDYTGTRSAVAEMTTALGTLGAGALAFHAVTPGMVSLAPTLAAVLAHQAAIAAFPLGAGIGSMWYGVFPVAASPLLGGAALVGLVMTGAAATAFAGVLADPVQLRLGIHQRRLNRLIDALEDGFTGQGSRAFAAREHYLARLLDVADAAVAAVRLMRA
ncbi:DUF6635 family protein [Paracoccaceae bacterium Fryx2]|nr:DUF6635 family protein [Paracoccaceae bacterium Fryx2]